MLPGQWVRVKVGVRVGQVTICCNTKRLLSWWECLLWCSSNWCASVLLSIKLGSHKMTSKPKMCLSWHLIS